MQFYLMRHFAFRIHRINVTHVNDGPCIDLRWLNIWNGYRVGPGLTARTFGAIAAYSKLLLVFDAVSGCM